jgi:hypothetical protein
MRGRTVIATALGLCGLIAALPAQSRPDFSGRWTSAPEPAAQAAPQGGERGAARGARGARRGGGGGRGARSGDMGSGWGEIITLSQDASSLTLEWAFFSRGDLQPPLRYTYALDGTPTTNAVTMGRGVQEERSRATWDGGSLVINSTYTFAHPETGEPVEGTLTRTLSLESPTTMVVEVSRAGVLGGPPNTTRTVYRKLAEG